MKIELRKKMLLKREKGELEEINITQDILIYRILDMQEDKILVIDCLKHTMPKWITMEEVADFVECREDELLEHLEMDFPDEESIQQDALTLMNHHFNMIASVLPFVSDKEMRTRAIECAVEEYNISKKTIRKYLCIYLAFQDKRAFIPQNNGNEGQRELTRDEKNMRKSLNRWYYTTKKRTLKNVYTLMLKEFYCDGEGKLLADYPSYYQLRYFYRKYNKKQTEFISREGLSCYQRNHRPLVGNGVQSFAPNVGVGMLDSTICDIYLVNEAGGIAGRPILTACADAYSGLCCGYSLSWEGGTYSLRDLMLNVITDKVEHCRQFGIEISESDWASHQLPGKLVTDMGSEYKGSNFEQITGLGVQLVNLPAYRPELKGPIEKFFDVVQGYYKTQLKGMGVIEPDFGERGVHDYRKDACLTLADFEKIILHCILFYNSKRILENFPYTDEMLEAEVKPYANEIWKWGCEQGESNLLSISKEQLIMALLPRTTGRFTKHGLSVNGMHYHNINFREQYLQGKECTVTYNPDDTTKVWLMENSTYIPFELIESRFKDKNLEGVQSMKKQQKMLVKRELELKTQAEIDLVNHIQIIAGMTIKKDKTSIHQIRDNRKREQTRTHKNFVKEVMVNDR